MTEIVPRFEMSDEEIQRVIDEDRARFHNPLAKASYDTQYDRVILEFENRMSFIVPRDLLQGLADLPKGDPILSRITILGSGSAVAWDDVDVAFLVESLLEGISGSRQWMKEVAARGGRAKSVRKGATARENGKKGGRPRKNAA